MPRKAPIQAHSEKVNIRLTTKMRDAIGKHCVREDLGELDMMRYLIEAGLSVVEKQGLAGVMAERSEFLGTPFPPPPSKRGPKPKPLKDKKRKPK